MFVTGRWSSMPPPPRFGMYGYGSQHHGGGFGGGGYGPPRPPPPPPSGPRPPPPPPHAFENDFENGNDTKPDSMDYPYETMPARYGGSARFQAPSQFGTNKRKLAVLLEGK